MYVFCFFLWNDAAILFEKEKKIHIALWNSSALACERPFKNFRIHTLLVSLTFDSEFYWNVKNSYPQN